MFLATLNKLYNSLLNLLLPPQCVNCKISGSWLCRNCLAQISFSPTEVCIICGVPAPLKTVCKHCQNNNTLQYLDGIRSATYFEKGPIRSAIHAFKYGNNQAISAILTRMLVEAYQRYQLNVDFILPVPLHASRLSERGYNQSELLATGVSLSCQVPLNVTTLLRVHHTETQAHLDLKGRYENVKNAFSCVNDLLSEKIVLLVDDVCTTGATLDACAMTLKKTGVHKVWALSIARVPHVN
ncbi:ComF family protein [Anaerolineales bacterium HSG6]|nr:ComF family protein [Anaerolineales bacterium HSG6]